MTREFARIGPMSPGGISVWGCAVVHIHTADLVRPGISRVRTDTSSAGASEGLNLYCIKKFDDYGMPTMLNAWYEISATVIKI